MNKKPTYEELEQRVKDLEKKAVGRKRAEEALRESEEKYKFLIDNSKEIILILSKSGKILFANKIAFTSFGYSEKEIIGRSITRFLTKDSLKKALSALAQEFLGYPQPEMEVRIKEKSSKIRYLKFAEGSTFVHEKGKLIGVMVNARDITQEKQAQEALSRRDTILGAVSSAAERFLRATSLEDVNVQEILAQLGQATNVSRVYVFENHIGDDGTHLTTQRYEWVSSEIMSQMDNPDLYNFPWRAGGMGRWEKTLRQGQLIQGYVREFPTSEQEILVPQNIQSIVAVPIFVEEKWWGFIGFDECQKEREWFTAEIGAIKTAGTILGALIERKQAEEALQEKSLQVQRLADELELIIDGIPGLVFFKDTENRFVRVNKFVADAHQRTKKQLEGTSCFELYSREMAQAYFEDDLEVIQSRRPKLNIDEPWKTEQGTRWLNTSKIPYLNEKGEITGVIGLSLDITERKKAEEALRESEEKYRNLIESLQEGVWVIDEDAKTVFVNYPMAEMLGYTEEEMLGIDLFEFMDEKAVDTAKENLERREAGITEQHDFEFIQKDGSRVNVILVTRPLTDNDGNYKGAIAGVINVTERMQAEEALRESEEKYRSLVESTEDSIYLVDRNCAYLFMNKMHLSRFGMKANEVIGRAYGEFHSKKETNEFAKRVNEIFENARSLSYEYRSDKNGRYYIRTLSPVKDLEGNIVAVTVVSKDITERKQAEEDLRQANEELSREHNQRKILSKRLIDLLEKDRRQIAMELHDHIGQTLTSIKMNLETIHGKLKPGHTELGDQMTVAQERTIQAIKDIKNVSHGLRPPMIDALGVVSSLRELCNEVQQQTDMEIHFFSRGIPKRFEEEKELAIYRIAQEALTNIIRHAQAKNVFVNLVKKDEKLSLSVEDDGAGFDYHKAMQTSGRKGALGLRIMRERAVQLDGEFTLESQPGKGTHLLVEIPL